MKDLNHPNLLHLHEAFEGPDESVLILEFLSGGELFEKIADEHYTMSEKEAAGYIRQMCEGLETAHEQGIVHLDIKPENVLCETSKSNNIKIIDFGLSCKLNPNEIAKASRTTAEFAAPEVANADPVGFYTDMWAVGVVAYILLSGISPFQGSNDYDTLENVRRGTYNFNDDSFRSISDTAKDFITKLLQKSGDKRLNVHEALEHPWLNNDPSISTSRIPANRYAKLRDQMRLRLGDYYAGRKLALGNLASFGSLRRNYRDLFNIVDVSFDRKEAGPRFVRKPHNQILIEGNTGTFECKVIAVAAPIISWLFLDNVLTQSVKYMQRYSGSQYALKINRCKMEDAGQYTVRAENSFGRKEFSATLTVEPNPQLRLGSFSRDMTPMRRTRREEAEIEMFKEEERTPRIMLPLRNRFLQEGISAKLSCTFDGFPPPSVVWNKDGRDLVRGQCEYEINAASGVSSLEIFNCGLKDAGRYVVTVSNSRGSDESACKVQVQESFHRSLGSRMTHSATSGFRHSSEFGSGRVSKSHYNLSSSNDDQQSRITTTSSFTSRRTGDQNSVKEEYSSSYTSISRTSKTSSSYGDRFAADGDSRTVINEFKSESSSYTFNKDDKTPTKTIRTVQRTEINGYNNDDIHEKTPQNEAPADFGLVKPASLVEELAQDEMPTEELKSLSENFDASNETAAPADYADSSEMGQEVAVE